MINLKKEHLSLLKQILNKFPYTFYIYGSRVKGEPQQFSDIDLCYKDDIPSIELFKIKDELEESRLPFFIDLVNFNSCSEDFKERIKDDLVEL